MFEGYQATLKAKELQDPLIFECALDRRRNPTEFALSALDGETYREIYQLNLRQIEHLHQRQSARRTSSADRGSLNFLTLMKRQGAERWTENPFFFLLSAAPCALLFPALDHSVGGGSTGGNLGHVANPSFALRLQTRRTKSRGAEGRTEKQGDNSSTAEKRQSPSR